MSYASDIARLTGLMKVVSNEVPRFRGMLYGESGTGKSVLACQVMNRIVDPDKGVLMVDTSEGWVSVKNIPGLAEGLVYLPFTTIEDLRTVIKAIRLGSGVWGSVGAVVLDEASSMAQIDLDRVFEKRKASGEARDDVPGWAEYREALTRFRIMLTELFEIPGLHVMLTAHTSNKKGSKGEILYTFPSFPPSTAAKVKEPLHLVANTTVGFKPSTTTGEPVYERVVQVHPTMKVDAKTRLNIPTVKVASSKLPDLVADWLKSGAHEAEEREIETDTQPISSENPFDLVDAELDDEIEPLESDGDLK